MNKEQLLLELRSLKDQVALGKDLEIKYERAREALREFGGMARDFLNAVTESALVTETNGAVVMCNETAAERFGFDVKDIVGRSIRDFLPPSISDNWKHMEETVRTGRAVRFEDEIMGRCIDLTICPIFDSRGEVFKLAVLGVDITGRLQAKERLHEQAHDLRERIKALSCMYGIADLVDTPGVTLDEIFQGVVDLIPPSWEHPQKTCAQMIINGNVFQTSGFTESNWKQTATVKVKGKSAGRVTVFYLGGAPVGGESPFSDEEGVLLRTIARKVGRVIERFEAEEALQKRTSDLGKRVRELNCLYRLSHLVGKPGASLAEILQGAVDLIPPSWQYPEMTVARVNVEGLTVKTRGFRVTNWKQTADIPVHGVPSGSIEVCCLEEAALGSESPFLREEENLLEAIASRLGLMLERFHMEKNLLASERRYRALVENAADGVVLFQNGRILYVNYAFAKMFGYENPDRLVGRGMINLVAEDEWGIFQEMHEVLEPGISEEVTFELQCLAGDGRRFWVEVHSHLIDWEGYPSIFSTMRDLTESKLKEKAIEEEAEDLRKENILLRSSIKDRYRFNNIIGKSPPMQEVYELILKASKTDANVIIYGESGTGKDLVARAIHEMSDRQDKAFIPVNCGAIHESLFESEFFGHKKGAFTGAHIDKHGYLYLAHGGTLFMDEISELYIKLQAKLLRALENGEYTPVGSGRARKADVRIISATNSDLKAHVSRGLMREDFFYRIHIVPITLPPLRARKEDIPLLVDYFLEYFSQDGQTRSLPGRVYEALYEYNWPGNVRELQNVLRSYLVTGRIDLASSTRPRANRAEISPLDGTSKDLDLHASVADLEKRLIIKALDQEHGHRGRAAAVLGIDRKTLFRKMKAYWPRLPQ